FQAEDGIRDKLVTGVQTWLFRSPYLLRRPASPRIRESLGMGSFGLAFTSRENHDEVIVHMAGEDQQLARFRKFHVVAARRRDHEIGRASCRERVWWLVGEGWLK